MSEFTTLLLLYIPGSVFFLDGEAYDVLRCVEKKPYLENYKEFVIFVAFCFIRIGFSSIKLF